MIFSDLGEETKRIVLSRSPHKTFPSIMIGGELFSKQRTKDENRRFRLPYNMFLKDTETHRKKYRN